MFKNYTHGHQGIASPSLSFSPEEEKEWGGVKTGCLYIILSLNCSAVLTFSLQPNNVSTTTLTNQIYLGRNRSIGQLSSLQSSIDLQLLLAETCLYSKAAVCVGYFHISPDSILPVTHRLKLSSIKALHSILCIIG